MTSLHGNCLAESAVGGNRRIRGCGHRCAVDSMRIGHACRALRIRRRWRQEDLAVKVGFSRQLISKVESGSIENVSLGTLHALAAGLGASIDVTVRWHGEGLDRLLDAAHASLVETVVRRLRRLGWETIVEASFAVRGERGSIDVLALDRATASVLVVEVKSVVPDSQATIHGLDRKSRLAPVIARDRDWPCLVVGRLLVIGESTTSRHRVEILDGTYRSAFPARGRAVSAWLRRPTGPLAGLLFLPFANRDGATNRVTGRQRVRLPAR
jgi:transcriptional regulator with XRE-family HTH domain